MRLNKGKAMGNSTKTRSLSVRFESQEEYNKVILAMRKIDPNVAPKRFARVAIITFLNEALKEYDRLIEEQKKKEEQEKSIPREEITNEEVNTSK